MPTAPSRSPRRPVAGLGLVLAVASLLGACQNDVVTGSLPEDGYRTRYPIVLAEAPEYLDIPVGMGAGRMSPETRASVRAFAADAAARGTGSLVVLTPSGSANEAAASYVARDIRGTVESTGLSSALVEMRAYRVPDPRAVAPIRLSFSRVKAVSPPCGRWTGGIMPGGSGGEDGVEFGCANQANLAAMVSNPNDLITPRAGTPIPAWRRWTVFDKYAKGEVPSGEYDTGNTDTQSSGSGSGG